METNLATPKKSIVENSKADRLSSYNISDFPPITGKEEDWRFIPLQRLLGLDKLEHLGGAGVEVFCSLGSSDKAQFETVPKTDKRVGIAGIPQDRVAALAWSSVDEVNIVTIPKNTEIADPIEVKYFGKSVQPTAKHTILVAETNSSATIVLDHTGGATLAENIEIVVKDAANLTVVTIQDWDETAVHVSAQHATLAKDAKLKHIVVSLGGNLIRTTPTARFTAPGGEVEMYGLYFADAGQVIEKRLFVDHAVANCKSRVTYKGALQGEDAHTIWVGDVLIRKAAEGTDTYELNRNLILTEGARADSVPNLEIETGLIQGAGHASATGRFDDEQLFYLQSRGIPAKAARRLVVSGFLNEIVQQINLPYLEKRLHDSIELELNRNVELEA